jgi:hypothetical protein
LLEAGRQGEEGKEEARRSGLECTLDREQAASLEHRRERSSDARLGYTGVSTYLRQLKPPEGGTDAVEEQEAVIRFARRPGITAALVTVGFALQTKLTRL